MEKTLKTIIISLFYLLAMLGLFSATAFADKEPQDAYTGFVEIDGDWCYVVENEIQSDLTGAVLGTVNEEYGWWYVSGGRAALDKTDILHITAYEEYAWWYIENGKITVTETIAENKHGTWLVIDGKVDFGYTGFYDAGDKWLYVFENKISSNKTGIFSDTVNEETVYWYFVNNVFADNATTVAKGTVDGEDAWWYVRDGVVTFIDTVAENKNGTWVIRGGKVDFDYTGFVENNGSWWYAENGKISFKKNDIINGTAYGEYGWWLIENSQVIIKDTLAKNSNGWWIIQSGKVNFDYTGFAENNNGWWYIENGKITFKRTDIIKGAAYNYDSWWYVKDSKVTLTNIVAKNSNGWWAVEGGRVTFKFNGFMKNSNGWWYVENSRVTFKQTGLIDGTVNGTKATWYVKDSKVQLTNTIYTENNKKYCIRSGKYDDDYTGYIQNKSDGTWWYASKGTSFVSVADKITKSLFVIVDCDEQTVYLVKKGVSVFSTPCVTGNVNRHNMTKRGLFYVYSKETDRDLKGADYISHVKYWMPFDKNRGLHDASWKKTFGGTEYLYHGSHGCVNLPPEAAKYIYNQVKVGTKVLVFGGKQTV